MESFPSPNSPEGLAEFHLTDLNTSHAGKYTCEYYTEGSPHIKSSPSDILPLVVTGEDRVLRIIYGLPRTGMREEPENERGRGVGSYLQCSWGGVMEKDRNGADDLGLIQGL